MLPSILRTVVPLIVGFVVSLLVRLGLDDAVDTAALTELVMLVVTAGYYAAVRALERYVDPRIGWLLGYAAQPKYATPAEQAAGLEPVPPSEVVAQVGTSPAVDDAFGRHAAPAVVAGPASPLPNGTPVVVELDRAA